MLQNRVMIKIMARISVLILGVLLASVAMATGGGAVTIGVIKTQVASTLKTFVDILSDVGIVTGVGFVLASFFKFHQHKMNPTQVGLSQGVTLLLVGAGVSVFPHLLATVTKGAFGVTAGGAGSVTGLIS